MKVVILGGGIAGITVGILLKNKNWDVVVNEKVDGVFSRGHAFLMNADGLSVLNELSDSSSISLNKKRINTFSLKRPNGNELIKIKLDPWYCIKRIDLMSFLNDHFPKECLKLGRQFSHFIYDDNKAIAAVFKNGEIEYGDLFIGADGSNSGVRMHSFGETTYTPIEVKEVVGVSKKSTLAVDELTVFQKFQHAEKGLSFGYIPTFNDESVWFMQYDTKFVEDNQADSKDLKSFCYSMLGNFPKEVKEVLDANNFENTYIWNTRDFDLLPSFSKDNIVLIGDAAHLALPFTSAGTTNAILDAKTLADCLEECEDYSSAFKRYYELRAASIKEHIAQGRDVKTLFLDPLNYSERDFLLPLVSETKYNGQPINKPLKIVYFTDPICSTCWLIQPILRKLKLEYDDYLDVDYKMGGLLPSWKDYNKGIIKSPSDAAKHWEEMGSLYNTPLDGDVWFEDPLDSSYPPSIAFKAAQLQNKDKAILFLRRIKEMVFIEKKNITKREFIEHAALSCGLDSAVLFRDIQTKAIDHFKEDLELAQAHDIKSFPTLMFSKDSNKKITLKGIQSYEKFEEIIKEFIPDVVKKKTDIDSLALFELYNIMTDDEFSFLTDTDVETAQKLFSALYKDGKIEKVEKKNGSVWKYIPS
jgi:2-polyprenyl-6-methoxyphenol hydroxylase-like FAD-dependent oxidoreductase/predicted DsbA family dithiol-disulfide isomerase